MSRPKFSIVIPTRQRHETLSVTLQTCLWQEGTDFEIVVCDNHSSPETLQVVESFGRAEIRYVRAPRPLAMYENWNLAVSKAVGEYVMVLGDDDGLLPNALRDVSMIVDRTKARAVRWPVASYAWPGMPRNMEHLLSIPIGTRGQTIDGSAMVGAVVKRRADRNSLPMLYNAAIHHSLISRLEEKTGQVFAACNPDIYSGMAFALLSGEYTSTGRVLAINATSAKSNGHAHFYANKESHVAAEFENLNSQSDRAWPERIPYVGIDAACVFEAYDQIRKNLSPLVRRAYSQKEMLKIILKNYASDPSLPPESVKRDIDKSIRDDHTRHWFKRQWSQIKIPEVQEDSNGGLSPVLGHRGARLRLDASKFGVKDVLQACRFCHDLMSYEQPVDETYPKESRARRFLSSSKRFTRELIGRG